MASVPPATLVKAMILLMTGTNAANGALWIKAAKLAEKQINAAGGINGKQIKLLIVDDQSTNPGALAAVNNRGSPQTPDYLTRS
jgi:ABC-type branched-subunit amino acid transport system substrate-binding protein